MQFFTMVNRLLATNPTTSKQALTVRTYSVTPLSDSCGVVSWVARHDTLRALIQLCRECRHADSSAEFVQVEGELMKQDTIYRSNGDAIAECIRARVGDPPTPPFATSTA